MRFILIYDYYRTFVWYLYELLFIEFLKNIPTLPIKWLFLAIFYGKNAIFTVFSLILVIFSDTVVYYFIYNIITFVWFYFLYFLIFY